MSIFPTEWANRGQKGTPVLGLNKIIPRNDTKCEQCCIWFPLNLISGMANFSYIARKWAAFPVSNSNLPERAKVSSHIHLLRLRFVNLAAALRRIPGRNRCSSPSSSLGTVADFSIRSSRCGHKQNYPVPHRFRRATGQGVGIMSFTKWKLRLAIYFIERNETKLSPVPGWLERSPCVGRVQSISFFICMYSYHVTVGGSIWERYYKIGWEVMWDYKVEIFKFLIKTDIKNSIFMHWYFMNTQLTPQ